MTAEVRDEGSAHEERITGQIQIALTDSLIGYSASRIQDRRLYLFAIGLFAIGLFAIGLFAIGASFGLHYLFTSVLAIGVPLFVKQPIPGSLWVISLVITTAVAPLIGLLAAFVVRRRMLKDETQ